MPAWDRAQLAEASLAFVAVKAFDLTEALNWSGAQLAPGTPVIPLANGAVEELVREAAARHPRLLWRLGLCTVGVSRDGAGVYAVRSKGGEVGFGPLFAGQASQEETPIERELVERGGGLFAWHGAIAKLHRRKWIYNTVINTLTAARRLPRNGDLLGDLATLSAVFNEALLLATERWGSLPLDRDTLYRGLLQLIESTADNENSMARDVRLGRRSEGDYLAGLARDERRYPLLVELHETIQQGSRQAVRG